MATFVRINDIVYISLKSRFRHVDYIMLQIVSIDKIDAAQSL